MHITKQVPSQVSYLTNPILYLLRLSLLVGMVKGSMPMTYRVTLSRGTLLQSAQQFGIIMEQ